jgi:hypothetical protein
MQVHLVQIDAWNISQFIFVTNKRRENAGASELITYLDRRWVHEALVEMFPGFRSQWRIESDPAELLLSGAGSVNVLVHEAEAAKGLVTAVTLKALTEAPGLDVCGITSELDWWQPGSLAAAVGDLHDDFGYAFAGRPGAEHRFQRLPIVDECATTGLPAADDVRQPDGRYERRSQESLCKWRAYGASGDGNGLRRLAQAAGTTPAALARVVDHLEDKADWSAVIYLDGNGLGRVFRDFDKLTGDPANRPYADGIRDLSAALARCTRQAFQQATASLKASLPPERLASGEAPVLPLVLGGDDVIAVCDGESALDFAASYLLAFEELTSREGAIGRPLARGGLGDRVAACAGVAIVKPHYPFTAAAVLADQLLREAKEVKAHSDGPCSALSFEVLYDSTDAALGRLRTAISSADPDEPAGQVRLYAQPYVVTEAPAELDGWMVGRHFSDLRRRVAVLTEFDGSAERVLPASQIHLLRDALHISPEVARARFETLRSRYPDAGVTGLAGPAGDLFWRQPDGTSITGLLDAMNAVGFLAEAAQAVSSGATS